MHAIKSAKHRNGVVAPQPAVTPNDLLRHPDDPTGNTGVATINKLPALPVFIAGCRAHLTRIVIRAATELLFMTVIFFAGKKGSTADILPHVGFESPVFVRA